MILCYVLYVIGYDQMEKCFCAKATLCPTINETYEIVVSDADKV